MALWPDRVVEKCTTMRHIAEKHDLLRFFWYDDPWSNAWRRRESPNVEVENEVTHRHKPAVKAALESLLSRRRLAPGRREKEEVSPRHGPLPWTTFISILANN